MVLVVALVSLLPGAYKDLTMSYLANQHSRLGVFTTSKASEGKSFIH